MKSKDQLVLEQLYLKIFNEETGIETGVEPKAQAQEEVENKVKKVEDAIDSEEGSEEETSEEGESEEGTGPQTPLEKTAENILSKPSEGGLSDQEVDVIDKLIKQG